MASVTVEMLLALVHTKGVARLVEAVKAPTFAPPVPAKVNVPPVLGKKLVGSAVADPYNPATTGLLAREACAVGPVRVMVDPALRPAGAAVEAVVGGTMTQLPTDGISA